MRPETAAQNADRPIPDLEAGGSGDLSRPPSPAAAILTELPVGARARLLSADLARRDGEILAALGLAAGCCFRVCRAGDPWIVQVRTTRIGLADAVARKLRVIPDR